jgi:hypothetical protein
MLNGHLPVGAEDKVLFGLCRKLGRFGTCFRERQPCGGNHCAAIKKDREKKGVVITSFIGRLSGEEA